MKKNLYIFLGCLVFVSVFLTGCGPKETNPLDKKMKVGVMLSDAGLGDESFSDIAFSGLMKARDELDIVFEYKEIKDTKTYEKGLTELAEADNDLIVGMGFMVKEDLEKVAQKYPQKQFLLLDEVSELENVASITFKEYEGSYLAGVLAALATKSNIIGFIGGDDKPLIQKFYNGFQDGAKSINPSIKVLVKYAGEFGNDKLGEKIAKDMITKKSDVLFASAGFTGVGVLKEAERQKVYAIGVDSDQYFYAEKAIISSMVKNIDVALYDFIKNNKDNKKLTSEHIELGIADQGVGLAPIRAIHLTDKENAKLQEAKQQVINGEIKQNQ